MEDIDEDTSDGYSGTFRWKKTKRLPSLPATESVLADDPEHLQESMKGWMQYLVSRCETVEECNRLVQMAKQDMSLIDCLSSPVSIGYALSELGIFPHVDSEPLHIVCMGCSAKCEERVLRQTSCWEELRRFVGAGSRVKVWLTGPEVSETAERFSKGEGDGEGGGEVGRTAAGVEFGLFRGTSLEFFRAWPMLMSCRAVAFGLNCGFGNWENPIAVRYNLLFNWLNDLYFLTGTKIPVVFTCANDFADVAGESGVMHRILGANFVIPPRENPFGFASTLIPPGVKPEDASRLYTRGNSYLYCVQGHDRARRVKVASADAGARVAEFLSLYNRPLRFDLKGTAPGGPFVVVPLVWPPAAPPPRPSATSPDAPVPATVSSEEAQPDGPCSTTSTALIGDSIEVSQSVDAETLVVVLTVLPTEKSFGPRDIDISYSDRSCEFLVSADHGRIAEKVAALQPIHQHSILAKASKARGTLTIRAAIIPAHAANTQQGGVLEAF